MTVKYIKGASIDDVKREMGKMLAEGSVDPSVRRLAEEAVAGKEDQLGAIFNFVRSTFPYIPDPIACELFVHPRLMAESYYAGQPRGEDCDGHALLTAAMLRSIGYESRIILADTSLLGELDHAYAQVNTAQGWIAMDSSSSKPMGWVYKVGETVVVS